jgi:hypothetical protein
MISGEGSVHLLTDGVTAKLALDWTREFGEIAWPTVRRT